MDLGNGDNIARIVSRDENDNNNNIITSLNNSTETILIALEGIIFVWMTVYNLLMIHYEEDDNLTGTLDDINTILTNLRNLITTGSHQIRNAPSQTLQQAIIINTNAIDLQNHSNAYSMNIVLKIREISNEIVGGRKKYPSKKKRKSKKKHPSKKNTHLKKHPSKKT